MKELTFKTRMEWRKWLMNNHDTCEEIWLVYYKKHTKKESVSYDEAVEEALCFGWIDSVIKSVDDEMYKQKYSPRRKNSVWSKLNKRRVEKMIKEGKMTEHGLKKIKEAKENGQWDKAYGSRENGKPEMPEEFKLALQKNEIAYKNFMNFPNSSQTTYLYWYLAAKRPETKENRLKKIIEFAIQNKKPGML